MSEGGDRRRGRIDDRIFTWGKITVSPDVARGGFVASIMVI
jgi:hypothetical protein